MELGVYQGKREEKSNEKKLKLRIKSIMASFSPAKATFWALLFFASRAQLFGTMMPFGAALIAAQYYDRIPYVPCLLAFCALLSCGATLPVILHYAVSVFAFLLAAHYTQIAKSPFAKGAALGSAIFAVGIIQKFFSGILLYDAAMLLLEGTITAAAVYLFSRGKNVLFTIHSGNGFVQEDIICAAALAGVGIMGLGGGELFGVSIAGCLCVLLALVLSYKNGAVCGAAAGVTIGLIAGLYRDNPVYILSAFAFAGALCGFFATYGRAACALSFLLADSLIMFYAVSFSSLLLNTAEIAIAIIIFVLLPHDFMSHFYIGAEKRRSYADKLRELTYSDLHESAQALHDVSGIFNTICENRLLGTESAVSSFFEKTARRLCSDCVRCKSCWRNEFHRTYTSFFVMLELCEKQGGINKKDIPQELCTKCLRRELLCDVFSGMYEVYKVDKLWESRVSESRSMLAKQLSCISARLEKTADSVCRGISFDSESESALSVFLMENAIKTKRIFFVNSSRLDLILADEDTDAASVAECVSRFTGDEYTVFYKRDERLTLCKAPRLRVQTARAQEAKNQNQYNGDSADFMHLEDGRHLLLLSDGMGSGERAGFDSHATVEITKKMLRAGFDVESTVSMVNSVLVLKSAETSFATLDMAVLDLKRGIASFYKSGAAASFIRRGHEVLPIASCSLPAGVIGKADVETSSSKIRGGDVIFMVSDGITGNEDIEQICSCISSVDISAPAEAARNLLKSVKQLHADIVSDDMTVLAAVVSEAS